MIQRVVQFFGILKNSLIIKKIGGEKSPLDLHGESTILKLSKMNSNNITSGQKC